MDEPDVAGLCQSHNLLEPHAVSIPDMAGCNRKESVGSASLDHTRTLGVTTDGQMSGWEDRKVLVRFKFL